MYKKLAYAILALFLPFAIVLEGIASQSKYGSFDRLVVVQKFLDAIYPDLKPIHGLLLSRAEEFHLSNIDGLGGEYIDVAPCRSGSGVPGGGGEPPSTLPHCSGLFLSTFSEFLTMSVGYSSRFPIAIFYASGSFVDGKSQNTKHEIAGHPEWTRQDWAEAVRRVKPRFGPEQRLAFLDSIPVATITEFTGCRLDRETALFAVDRLEAKPDAARVEIQWAVRGKRQNPQGFPNGCRATFEPFDGKLLSVDFRLK